MAEKYIMTGKWIQGQEIDYGEEDEFYYQDHPHTILKRSFVAGQINEAKFYIGCLGYYIIYINGQRVGNDELNNDWTNYQKCVYYETYDVSSYLEEGNNEIVIELGNGMYNPSPLRLFGKYNLRERLHEVGQPKIICDLWINQKLVLSSDEQWQYCLGNILFNNLYLGETVDFSLQESQLYPVYVCDEHRNLVESFIPKIKRHQTVQPQKIEAYKDGLFVDFGEMISGFIHIEVNAQLHQKITLQYSENFVDGEFDYTTVLAGSVGEQMGDITIYGGKGCPKYGIQTDCIICQEGFNSFENKFCYHSFRYVYIEGCQKEDITDLYAIYVHTDLKQIGKVKTDHPFLNELFDAATRTKLNNVHGTFEDCARERLGYGGDMVALATSQLYMFDLEALYKKILLDFRFEQTSNGGLPETAPYMGIQSNGTSDREGPILWQLVYPYLIYKRYQFYGDKNFIEEEYPYLQKHIQYLMNYDLDELVHRCLGDHGSILIAGEFRKPTPDKVLLGYCTVLLLLKYNILLGQIIDKDVTEYIKRYDEIKDITIEKLKNEDGSFGDGTQSGYAFAIELELDDPKVLCEKFVQKIQSDDYILNSGIFGMALTYEVLNRYGYDEVIEKWLLQDGAVSYKHMLETGNQALAELFIGDHLSLNHAMFASYQQWYFQALGGIQICEDAVGFNKVKLKPYFSQQMNRVECEVETKHGIISSCWNRESDQIIWQIHVPDQIDKDIIIPESICVLKQQKQNGKIVYYLKKK